MFYHNFGKCELIYKTFNCQILQKLARFDDENLNLIAVVFIRFLNYLLLPVIC